jgi:hypothetical protein
MRLSFRIFALAAATAAASCGDAAREGRAPVSLVLNQLTASAGGGHNANQQSATLFSDVIVNVTSPDPCSALKPCPTIFADSGSATMSLQSKNPTIAPSGINAVTIDRVHIEYVRADGHNTPGVDVPFAFDGAVTATVPASGTAGVSFEIVRHAAKEESPLIQLISSPTIITTICHVTFYGHDQAGNAINVTGSIQIDFGNFGDQ